MAQHKQNGQQVAVKQFTKRRLKDHRLHLLKSEVEVYLQLDHPHICRLLYAYEGRHDVWLVMELCGCELYSRLCQRKVYRERDAAEVMRQMLQAVNYLHSHHIVHRDLKLENWMYGCGDRDDRLKLIDFGFSRKLDNAGETLDMPCGTLHYTSPEVLARKYTSQCDLWSMGVICYMLLLGRPPFRGSNNVKIAKAILHGEYPRDGHWELLTEDARDFLTGLLHKDPGLRFDAAGALSHRWITGAHCTSPPREIGADVLRSLRGFAQGSHLRRAALTALAYSLTSKELQDLEQTFLDFDTTGRGTISLDQLREVMQEHLEVSAEEVQRIFQCFDFSQEEEIHYTPFVAALLATRVQLHEDKVRAAFEAFDRDGSGYITADGLVQIFASLPGGGKLTKEEAEQWIQEVDYKGNGVIDYAGFLAALTGKNLWALPSMEESAERPTLRVYEEDGSPVRPCGLNESFVGSGPTFGFSSSKVRHSLASVIIDADADRRSQSFTPGSKEVFPAAKLQIRNVSCDVDEQYFA